MAGTLPEAPAERLASLEDLKRQIQGGAQAGSAALLQLLLRQLPSPPDAGLYADVAGAPSPPATAQQAALAMRWAAVTALQLQLAAQLAAQLDAAQLELEALAAPAAGADGIAAPLGPAGSVRIEELDGDTPTAALPAEAVLAASLYGSGDGATQRPWAPEQVAAAAQQLLEVLAARLADVLAACRHQQVGQQAPAGAPLLSEVATSRVNGSNHSHSSGGATPVNSNHQPEQVQQLLALALPLVLSRLRPVLAAKVEHSRHKTMRLEPYTGPGNFERCVAAGQLAWLVRQLDRRHVSTATSAALPLVLAAIEDPFPPAQACGLRALQHMADEGQAADLRPHAQLVLRAGTGALAGASDDSWPAAAAAAIAVASRVEGSNPYAQPYHDVMTVLLDEGELGAHRAERAAAWLAAAPRLFPCLGLQLAAHFGRLMPLLLGWCLAAQKSVRAAALEALLLALRLTWPRAGAHAAALWPVLRRVHEEAEGQRRASQPGGGSSQEAARAVADRAEDCALALWYAAGTDFQVQLMTGRGAAGDELLQAIMQRLEDCSQAEASISGSREVEGTNLAEVAQGGPPPAAGVARPLVELL